ncbi:SH3 domain-containing protein [Leeia sp. TBRC 13508]|uniref:SH3 domain-containing protein n=1 Tax=Leeia speluncae TaxID=2884804 RepID=A0ABS8D5S4_9NEIS|nr:SH3 domain-containing protein [Leeia speluncae]MCB6183532.1 SH3 domain-containing protein [Leeia speluncae]
MRFWFASLMALSAFTTANALEFRSAVKSGVVLYESPASTAKKVFLVSEGYPVEVVISQGEWLKIRDASGALAWGHLPDWSNKRTVMVLKEGASLYAKPEPTSPILSKLTKSVWFSLSEPSSSEKVAGWLKVQHKSGAIGWLKQSDVWGY